MSTHFAIYERRPREMLFWVAAERHGNPTAAISRAADCVTIVSTDRTDTDELLHFLQMTGTYTQVQADYSLCSALAVSLGGKLSGGPSMRYLPSASAADISPSHISSPPPDALYAFLCAVFPPSSLGEWPSWYTYHSHLFRHELGFAAGIFKNGKLIATGGVYATNPRCNLIANIATAPAFRRRGYGSQLVEYLCAVSCRQGKIPVLHCADQSLVRFYAPLGFAPARHWGVLQQYT